MQKLLLKTYTFSKWSVVVEVVDFQEGSNWFNELYTAASEHLAGTTIRVPPHLRDRHSPEYYVGQTKPSELTKDYAKQGRDNPEQAAKESLEKELGHYIEASDCSLKVSVFKNDIELSSEVGSGFDWSYGYCGDLEEYATKFYSDFIGDAMEEALLNARDNYQALVSD